MCVCVCMYVCVHLIIILHRKGTVQACALVAGAAALVLEKYPHFTPAQVKQHLIDEATDVAIDVSKAKRLPPDAIKGKNKLLFVGYGMCIHIIDT